LTGGGRGGAGTYPSAAEIERARGILRRGWAERAAELGRPEPVDLVAAAVFGGAVRANHAHAWVEIEGAVLDLTTMPREAVRDCRADPTFEHRREFAESLKSCRPRVRRWVAEFGRGQTG
jgi:hypothetical protein